jgi:flagellar biosynthesis/type III secretory pathway protein FliH
MTTRRIRLTRPPSNVRLASPSAEAASWPPDAARRPQPEPVPTASSEASHDIAQTVESIFDAIAELERRRQQSVDELRELAIELACAITSHVFADMIEQRALPLEALIDQALAQLGVAAPQSATVRLHPDDYQTIRQAWELEADRREAATRPALAPDARLKRGSCEATVEGAGVLLDIDGQLKQIHHELLRTLNHAKTERRNVEENDRHVQRYPDRRDTA